MNHPVELPPIKRLLIANRGEIACRIIRTAKKMGIYCIAVYSDEDKQALHVNDADEAWWIGEALASESYLNATKILAIAKKSNADAIHPGYGFLSENTPFVEACESKNIRFIGPSSKVIQMMGEKNEAKRIMSQAGIPVIPGYYGENQDPFFLKEEGDKMGYPLLIKAIAGGGGKGMRVVSSSNDFLENLKACQRESLASFSNKKILLEKYLQSPRHIEVQIVADTQGNVIHLLDRDCSLQRRHQKVIEEAPAPNIPSKISSAMGKVAVNAAKAIDYCGAGTIEFLYDGSNFYFMEMNTRLQVEHAITEKITHIDLVEWQIKIANGHVLPLAQTQIKSDGHAFEARIYAEDPNSQFLPMIGKMDFIQWPEKNSSIRMDVGVRQGDSMSPYYDPLIAKLIVWGKTRDDALEKIKHSLSQCYIAGIKTNLSFLYQIVLHPSFSMGAIHTRFLENTPSLLYSPSVETIRFHFIVSGLVFIDIQKRASQSLEKNTAWHDLSFWRMNQKTALRLNVMYEKKIKMIEIRRINEGYIFCIDKIDYIVSGRIEKEKKGAFITVQMNGYNQKIPFYLSSNNKKLVTFSGGMNFVFNFNPPQLPLNSESNEIKHIFAPMPGIVTQILVSHGEKLKKGAPLMIIEAMKMEHTLYTQKEQCVKKVLYRTGDFVNEGVELIEFEAIK
jgi:3-methylcrotonyl-CoA carboxylase alpha subunit